MNKGAWRAYVSEDLHRNSLLKEILLFSLLYQAFVAAIDFAVPDISKPLGSADQELVLVDCLAQSLDRCVMRRLSLDQFRTCRTQLVPFVSINSKVMLDRDGSTAVVAIDS